MLSLLRLLTTVCRGDASSRPSTMLMILGGSRAREQAAVESLGLFQDVKLVLLSSGSMDGFELYKSVVGSIPSSRPMAVVADRAAVDTVTNCTTVCHAIAATKITSVVVVTEHAHLRRASLIAIIVFGALGITVRPHGVSAGTCSIPPESWSRCWRDALRALLFVISGFDGSTVAHWVYPMRAADSHQARKSKLSLQEQLGRGLTIVEGLEQRPAMDSRPSRGSSQVHLIS